MSTTEKIKLNLNTRKFIHELGKRGNQLQIAAAEAVNESAEEIDQEYKNRLQRKQRIRNKKFTLGGIKLFKANPIRRSGEPRAIGKINAIIGVMKMKKGKKHYLAELEEGSTNRGNPSTLGKVPVPLEGGRTSTNINKPVAKGNRLPKNPPQNLKISGKPFGTRGDRMSPKQRFGILYAQKKSGYNRLQGDVRKPFFFIGKDNNLGIYRLVGKIFRKIRNAHQTTTKTDPQPHFKNSLRGASERIQKNFIRIAKRKLGRTG